MGQGRLQRRGNGSRTAAAGSLKEARSALAERLRDRLPEIEAAVATRVYSIADPHEVSDAGYLQGLNAALAAAVEHRLAVLESGERHAPVVPAELLAQARLDARDGVALETVLRRYFAGNAVFGDFLVEEAGRAEVDGSTLRRLLGEQATLGDRLVAAVSAEHEREARSRPSSPADRRRECVKRLLAGELVDHSDLDYDLDGHHLGLMVKGEGVEELMREVAGRLDRRLLAVKREDEPKWAWWLGGRRELPVGQAVEALAAVVPEGMFVTVGEPAESLAGWRFSHFQAKAALPVAERKGRRVVRYAEVAVLAAVLRDDLVLNSLRRLYLAPLEETKDSGAAARETLRAYFSTERNISSTAAALGVDRATVRNRLRAIEGLLGRSLADCAADLEIALRLED